MKDYERYMNRQRMSETSMARLLKLETEKPEKRRKPAPRWARTLGMAASLVLVVGLCALPLLRWAGQWAQPAEEELFFYEEDTTDSFVDGSRYGEEKKVLEPGEAAEIFGCAPDDFVGFLETMGLEKFDMRYRVMDTGSDYFRFLMEGFYTSPREKPENWDEFSEISWEMWQGLSAVMPYNNVVLDIREIRPEAAEDWSWCRYEPRTYHGCQVVAVCETRGYSASAVFHVESGGKTYQVIYGVDLYAQGNAKELVTKMVSYLTTNGLFIEDRGTPRVKTTGLYVMERGGSDYPVMPRIFFDGESYTFGQSLLSSHLCRGGYEVANGRVTARCDEHHFVFDIVDENTLRFVAAESSKPTNYKGEAHITDGALFRWQAEAGTQRLVFNEVEKVPPQVNSPYDMELSGRLDVTGEETEMLLQAGPEDLGWSGLEVVGSSWPLDGETYFSFDGMDATVDPTCSVSLRLMPNMTDFKGYMAEYIGNWDSLTVSEINGHSVMAMSGKSYTPNFYCAAAAFEVEDVICDYGVYYAVEHEDRETAEAMVTQLVNYMTGHAVFTEMYRQHGGEGALTLEYAELTQPYAEADFYKALEKNESRELTKDELEAVFPAAAEEAGVNYRWTGTAWFKDDGNLQLVSITGEATDGSGTVTITTSMEEELTFIRNMAKKNGKPSYFGTDNAKYVYGADLVRCFYVNEPGHFNNAPGACYCYAQCQLTGSPLYTEVRTSVSEGSLQENMTFNTQWFDTVTETGLWFQTGTVNGKDIWKLPKVEEHSVQEYTALDDLRAAVDEKFLPYLPTTLMDHDEFHGIWRRNNAEYESVDARWDKPWVIQGSYSRFSYSGDVDVKWPLVAMGLPQVTDINDRENYDFRNHPGLTFPDSMSSEYTGIYVKLECPTFRARDASLDLIESRIYRIDENNTECRFQLLHDNNVLVRYQFHGMTAEEIWTVVQETIPGYRQPQVEITDLGSSLWEDYSGTDRAKGGVKYELTYQANEAAVGKRLKFYMELPQEACDLLGLDDPVCLQTICREAGECGSVKEVYGDFTLDAVSGKNIGDVTVRCVCDGEEIACKTMPWGKTYKWGDDTHHPEPTRHVEEVHHSDNHH